MSSLMGRDVSANLGSSGWFVSRGYGASRIGHTVFFTAIETVPGAVVSDGDCIAVRDRRAQFRRDLRLEQFETRTLLGHGEPAAVGGHVHDLVA